MEPEILGCDAQEEWKFDMDQVRRKIVRDTVERERERVGVGGIERGLVIVTLSKTCVNTRRGWDDVRQTTNGLRLRLPLRSGRKKLSGPWRQSVYHLAERDICRRRRVVENVSIYGSEVFRRRGWQRRDE